MKEAMKLALEALMRSRKAVSGDLDLAGRAYGSNDPDGHRYDNAKKALVTLDKAIAALREALAEQPAKQDIPDLIAGALGVSRGTAYDLMRAALAEQEPVPAAMKTVIQAMQQDPDYAWSWHCNIAMAFVDAGGDHYTGNQGAAHFMKMLASVEPAHELPSQQPAQQEPTTLFETFDQFGEGWERLAWELCAEEHGEDACSELLWEGSPIPEPWGDRWLKYEDEAKRLIELVRKCATPQPPAQRKPLTLGQKQKLWSSVGNKPTLKDRVNAYGLAIEAAHNIKEQP